jgi:YidC/Oxa1 family membrane protein insertase
LYFQPDDSTVHNATANSDSLTMKLPVADNKYIEYRYILDPGSYMVGFAIQLVGLNDIVTRDPSAIDLSWEINIPQHEQLKSNENQYTALYFRHYKGMSTSSRHVPAKTFSNRIFHQIEWVAFRTSSFLLLSLLTDPSPMPAKSTTLPEESKYLKISGLNSACLSIALKMKPSGLKCFMAPTNSNC